MKKTFRIILSAIICFAMLLVPMSVMAEEGIDYNINYETYLTEGTNMYPIDSTVTYTVYYLYPSDVGDYVITSDDCVMGIVSYIDLWVQFEPTSDIVNLNKIEWSCNDANQAIMIALFSQNDDVSITVTRKDLDTSDDIPWIIYENTTKPEKFEMPSFVDVDAFEDGYVDFEDDVIDDAVLGNDGYYHLNDKNGPVLFVNLNDSIMSLYTMIGYGKLSAVYYDENGTALKVVEYTDAFLEYVDALPTDADGNITSFYYPLTADLIEMYKEIGASHEWYSGSAPWVYASEDAWLFACYYDEAVTSMGDVSNEDADSNDKDDATTDDNQNKVEDKNDTAVEDKNNNSNVDTNKVSPSTGDNLVALSIAIVSAASIFLGTKKSK